MSIELCILASGSSGNASVLRTPGGVVLIDCGIGPRTAANRLKGTGVHVNEVRAVCLTHLDRDHFNLNWLPTLARQGGRIFCAARHYDTLHRIAGEQLDGVEVQAFEDQPFEVLPDLQASAISVAHDETGSFAFRFENHNAALGFATDLGYVPRSLMERFSGVDVLALESNYDPDLQRTSGRPWFLQQRIMNGRGHLSNQQAFAAVRYLLDHCQHRGDRLPKHVVLLHRSQQCNCPNRVRDLFCCDGRIRSRLVLAEQHCRTEWLRAANEAPRLGRQLTLGWG